MFVDPNVLSTVAYAPPTYGPSAQETSPECDEGGFIDVPTSPLSPAACQRPGDYTSGSSFASEPVTAVPSPAISGATPVIEAPGYIDEDGGMYLTVSAFSADSPRAGTFSDDNDSGGGGDFDSAQDPGEQLALKLQQKLMQRSDPYPMAGSSPAPGSPQPATLDNISVQTTGRANGYGFGWGHPILVSWDGAWNLAFHPINVLTGQTPVGISGAQGSYDVAALNGIVSVTSDVAIWSNGNETCNTPVPVPALPNGGQFVVFLKNQPAGDYEVEFNYASMVMSTASKDCHGDIIPVGQKSIVVTTNSGNALSATTPFSSDRCTVVVTVPYDSAATRIVEYMPALGIGKNDILPSPSQRATANITILSIRRIK